MFYLHELALLQRFGSDEVMKEQYLRLLSKFRMIRIVPLAVPAISAGLALWDYKKAMSVAHSDSDLAKVFVQDPGAIARIRLTFNRLAEVSLDEEQSRRKLAEYAGRPREELDDSGSLLA
jgi:hypothetical protein